MKIEQYKAMLRALEQALEICDKSSGFMDEIQREICQNLRATRARLMTIINAAKPETT